MNPSTSEFVAQALSPWARGVALLVMLLLLAAGLILSLMLARWGKRWAMRDHKRKQSPQVDAWEEAGRRFKPDDEDRDESQR